VVSRIQPLEELRAMIQDLSVDLDRKLLVLYSENRFENQLLDRFLQFLHEAPERQELLIGAPSLLDCSRRCGRTEELEDAVRHLARFHPNLKTAKELMIKRVLGLPGEYVEMRDGVVYIDGRPLAEPYVRFSDYCDIALGRIGPDRFVLAGDNRPETLIEMANRERIVGRLRPRRGGRYPMAIRFLTRRRFTDAAQVTAAERGNAPAEDARSDRL
jgi:hypothetical protein